MENIVLTYFDVESEAYQALSDVKHLSGYDNRVHISQVALSKNENGKIALKDGFDTGKRTSDDTVTGGLIGMLIGILGGPLGMLLGLGTGSLIGAAKDSKDYQEEKSLISSIAERMKDGDVAIVAVIQEATEEPYNRLMEPFDALTIRFDASVIQEEVEHAQEVENNLKQQAQQQLRQSRSAHRKAKIEEYKSRIKEEFDNLKGKIIK